MTWADQLLLALADLIATSIEPPSELIPTDLSPGDLQHDSAQSECAIPEILGGAGQTELVIPSSSLGVG